MICARPLWRVAMVAAFAALAAVATVAAAAPAGPGASTALTVSNATSPTPPPQAATARMALVVRDQAALRAGPRDTASQLAALWQGEVVEVRGEKADYAQVWDHGRERGGYVRTSQLHRLSLAEADAPALLAVLRFVRDTPGAEALGVGVAAAWLQAAPADAVRGARGVEAFDALGGFADRLAQRASAGAGGNRAAEQAIAAHLDVAARYGVRFATYEAAAERAGKVQVCYDGEAFRRVLAMADADAAQKAHAALALTRERCIDPRLGVIERAALDDWRAGVLDRVDTAALPATLKNRVAMRRAGVWSAIAYRQARADRPAEAQRAAERSLAELGQVVALELSDDDQGTFADAAMRVNASRWAAVPPALARPNGALALRTAAGEPGQTCVELVDSRKAGAVAAKRCTFGHVWLASATTNREGSALAVAVQTSESWRELWLFSRQGDGSIALDVLPPAATPPGLGFAEFAGWVPGGRQVLVAREARGDGKYKRAFEVIRIAGLVTERQAFEAAALGPFQRWTDPAWKRDSVAMR